DRAATWYRIPPNSIFTWPELEAQFLAKYFPHSLTVSLKNELMSFKQKDNENLFDAWERYRTIQHKCPHHGLPNWLIIQ
ncbi:hypothetical protein HA388_32425, partial [Escherichia coli]|nr:hypothetical protein [Escherichia coli]